MTSVASVTVDDAEHDYDGHADEDSDRGDHPPVLVVPRHDISQEYRSRAVPALPPAALPGGSGRVELQPASEVLAALLLCGADRFTRVREV